MPLGAMVERRRLSGRATIRPEPAGSMARASGVSLPSARWVRERWWVDHDLRCLAEPPTGRRARDSEVRGDGHVPGALDEISKPVVVALLKASHADAHRPFAHAAQLLEGIAGPPPT